MSGRRHGRPWNSSKHSVRRDGMTHLICGICDTEGPPHASNTEARKHLAEDGWSRCYTGSEDQLRCPDCRATRPVGRNATPPERPASFPFIEVDGVEWCYVHEAEYVEGNSECGDADEYPCMSIPLFRRAGDS
jgi:hypothetical protein